MRVGDEEVAHLEPAEVEHVRAPVGLVAAARVRVLVERQPVEPGQGERVAGEVPRHPVEDDADAGLVQRVDEVLEVVRGAEPRGRGVVAGDLVAPRGAVRVLHDGQQLDVGEPEVGDVVDQVLGQVAVRHALAPRAEVHLVDAHRALVRVAAGALLHPGGVGPLVAGLVDDRAGVRRALGAPRHRVGLGAHDVVGAADLVLVDVADPDVRHEQLPDPGGADQPHRVDPAVPVVEVADDAHGLGPRRPHRERHPAHVAHRAVVLVQARAEHGPQLLVTALVDQVQVDLAQGRGEPVGVVLQVLDPVGPRDERAGSPSCGSRRCAPPSTRPRPRGRGPAPRRPRSAPAPTARGA